MRRGTVVMIVVVAFVLLPMWYVASHGESPSAEIELDQSVSEIRPLDGPVDSPTKLSPSQVGVIVWVALFALLGVLAFFHRFMNRAARSTGGTGVGTGGETDATEAATDGGTASFSWLETEDRWVVEHIPASGAVEGLAAMGALSVLTIAFAALFTGEYLTLARTQYFGIYAFGLFMSLTGLTVSYYAWFMPHVEVAERRGH